MCNRHIDNWVAEGQMNPQLASKSSRNDNIWKGKMRSWSLIITPGSMLKHHYCKTQANNSSFLIRMKERIDQHFTSNLQWSSGEDHWCSTSYTYTVRKHTQPRVDHGKTLQNTGRIERINTWRRNTWYVTSHHAAKYVANWEYKH